MRGGDKWQSSFSFILCKDCKGYTLEQKTTFLLKIILNEEEQCVTAVSCAKDVS